MRSIVVWREETTRLGFTSVKVEEEGSGRGEESRVSQTSRVVLGLALGRRYNLGRPFMSWSNVAVGAKRYLNETVVIWIHCNKFSSINCYDFTPFVK